MRADFICTFERKWEHALAAVVPGARPCTGWRPAERVRFYCCGWVVCARKLDPFTITTDQLYPKGFAVGGSLRIFAIVLLIVYIIYVVSARRVGRDPLAIPRGRLACSVHDIGYPASSQTAGWPAAAAQSLAWCGGCHRCWARFAQLRCPDAQGAAF